ncbi:tetraacyldisaccharide 4'-kinase [Acidithiobacillus sp. YTS05]|uniref:tetraacyldisaccharide 4'-kinase n=1 Tax=Igneacidithiobacillus copahuensis TaxID=2724909 RepID=UPI001D02B0C0|nr:tetraacyldisaccharide 4'-kinase [Igneacidithiobacillus copahuensis]UTV81253.1 tetraacyldisaccharide 4'-kinase [Acidithiobacillus sp. YTS05]
MLSWRQELERQWYAGGVGAYLLRPLGAIYCALAARRRARARRLPGALPSIVVGNLNVGGSAKTPMTMALLRYLQSHSWHPAAISRGYGAHPPQEPYAVLPDDSPVRAGDEPLLLRSVAPVFLSRRRHAGILAAANAGHDIVVLDDGFQHLALQPSLSLLLLQGERPLGNGRCLPSGPLREAKTALQAADALLCDPAAAGSADLVGIAPPCFRFEQQATRLVPLHDPVQELPLQALRNRHVHAVTGIARPERFQRTLEVLGAQVTLHSFPDHHVFRQQDLVNISAPLVITSKDAVKCMQLAGLPEIWVLEIGIHWEPSFSHWLDQRLATWRSPQ